MDPAKTAPEIAAADNIADAPAPEIAAELAVAINAIVPAAAPKKKGAAKPPAEKKKPGRPKKTITNIPIEVHGITPQPINKGDLLELVYCNPGLFKKILVLLKQFEVSEVELNFNKEGLRIKAQDHIKKSTIYMFIDGRPMNVYYCEMPIKVCVKRSSLENVFAFMGKTHYKITFLLKENYRSMMYIIIKDSEYDTDESFEVDVIYNPDNQATIDEPDESDYPLRFCLASKYLKTRITSIGKLSQVMKIQKCGDEPLQLTFDKAQMVNWNGVINDNDKLQLKSTLKPFEPFNVSVCIDYIKPFTNSTIGDLVTIAAHSNERLFMSTQIGKSVLTDTYACTIKVFTEIKEYTRVEPVAEVEFAQAF